MPGASPDVGVLCSWIRIALGQAACLDFWTPIKEAKSELEILEYRGLSVFLSKYSLINYAFN